MRHFTAALLAGVIAGLGAPALAQEQEEATPAEVVERDADGRATKISIDGTVYDVCTQDNQDNCINPRAAGLDFGGVPIDYWPGRPASEIDGPLPAEQPAAIANEDEDEGAD